MGRLLRRLRYWLGRDDQEAALAEELEFHRALKQQELEADGIASEDARFASRREMGNLARAREDARGVWVWPWLESLVQDIRYSIRGLLATPSFTLPALGVLVLTMGLATSVYAIVDAFLFRPWPVPDPDRVVLLFATRTFPTGATIRSTGHLEYRHLEANAQGVTLTAFISDIRGLNGAESPEESNVRFTSGTYFDVLRIPIVAGRPLYASDDVRGAAPAIVVSESLADRDFGGPASAIGRVMRVGETPHTIVGVAARGAKDVPLARAPDVWLPMATAWNLPHSQAFGDSLSMERFFSAPEACCVQIAGRLEPGVDRAAVESVLAVLAERFAAAHGVPPATITLRGTAWIDNPGRAQEVDIAALFSAAVFLVLLLGAANVGNLVLARAASRRQDVNVRLSLGATRQRLVRQLLTESLTLSMAAALVSFALARGALPILLGRLPWPFSSMTVPVDLRTMLFVAALALLVAMISGALPALRTTRIGAGGRAVGAMPTRLRSTLLGAQVAICLVLLVGAGLLARGIHHATTDGLGFSLDGVTAVRYLLPSGRYSAEDYRRVSATIFAEAARAGLSPLAGARFAPYTAYQTTRDVRLPPGGTPAATFVVRHTVTPEYFDQLRITVVAGQIFGPRSPAQDVVVNETLARQLWADQPAIGRVFIDASLDEAARERRVVGVVGDARSQSFNWSQATYYERATAPRFLLHRGGSDDTARLSGIIRQVAPGATVSVIDMNAGLREQVQQPLIGAAAAASVALLALLLAVVGTLGVFSYLVTEQLPEIGVRKALGATGRDIVRLLLRRVSKPLLGGLSVGLLGAQVLGQLLGTSLYGLSPRDPIAYLVVFAVLAMAALFALTGPARRAVRVDPASMLRAE